MAHPPADESIIKWVIGIVASAGTFLFGWVNVKINREIEILRDLHEKKVSKDVFKQFEKGNDEQHAYTQNALAKQGETLDKIFDKLDGKQDK